MSEKLFRSLPYFTEVYDIKTDVLFLARTVLWPFWDVMSLFFNWTPQKRPCLCTARRQNVASSSIAAILSRQLINLQKILAHLLTGATSYHRGHPRSLPPPSEKAVEAAKNA